MVIYLCFKYVVTAALNHESIGKHRKRITKIRPHIRQYDWRVINFPAEQKTGKNLKQNFFFYQTTIVMN